MLGAAPLRLAAAFARAALQLPRDLWRALRDRRRPPDFPDWQRAPDTAGRGQDGAWPRGDTLSWSLRATGRADPAESLSGPRAPTQLAVMRASVRAFYAEADLPARLALKAAGWPQGVRIA